MIDCHVCSSGNLSLIFNLKTHKIFRCKECFVYQNGDFDKNAPEDTFNESYYMKVQSSAFAELKIGPSDPSFNAYSHGLDLLHRNIESLEQPRLLDVGAAFGSFVTAAIERGWQAQGVEISHYSSRVAREKFGLEIMTGGIANLEPKSKEFDAITLWDSIEHIKNTDALFMEIDERLVEGGVILISTDNYDSLIGDVARSIYDLVGWDWPLRRFLIPQNTVYFSPQSLSDFLSKRDFKIVHLELLDYPIEKINVNIFQRLVLSLLYRRGNRSGRNSQFLCIAKKV